MSQWKELLSVEGWEEVFEKSAERPVVVLKHSTTCPVSHQALEEFEAYLADKPNQAYDYYLVKVIESRPVSNRIAEQSGVKHESPQILSFKDRTKYWSASHWSVTKAHMTAVLD